MKKILLIENDEMNLENTANFLKNEGFNVFTCNNTADGLSIAAKIIPDAIVSDLSLSGANEFEICKSIRSQAATSLIPVIYITEKPQDIMIGMQIGANDFLPKPFSFHTLVNTINNCL